MHLLLAQKGAISDGNEAIDLGQSPGDIVFLSAADTELAAMASAQAAREGRRPLRVASLMQLMHPMSVDTYVERTARHAKLIVVRALGGASYFAYALETLHAAAANAGALIAVLPGDDKPDDGLAAFCNVARGDCEALWRYLIEGGADNSGAFSDYCAALIDGGDKPGAAVPLLKAGAVRERHGRRDIRSRPPAGKSRGRNRGRRRFYRALVQSGQTQPVEALCRALDGGRHASAAGLRLEPQGPGVRRHAQVGLRQARRRTSSSMPPASPSSAPGAERRRDRARRGRRAGAAGDLLGLLAPRPGQARRRAFRRATWR